MLALLTHCWVFSWKKLDLDSDWWQSCGRIFIFMMCCFKKLPSTSFYYRQHFQHLPCSSALIWLSLSPSVLKAFFSGFYPFFDSLMWTKWNLCMMVSRSFTTTKPHLANRTALMCLLLKYMVTLTSCHKIRLKYSWNKKKTHRRFCLKLFYCISLLKFSKYDFFFLFWRSLGLKSCRVWFSTKILPR